MLKIDLSNGEVYIILFPMVGRIQIHEHSSMTGDKLLDYKFTRGAIEQNLWCPGPFLFSCTW